MREILFRGKDKYTKEWIYGGFVHEKDYYGLDQDKYFIVDGTDTIQYLIGTIYEVVVETVGQFTGLYDKNGQRIFEGDILKTNNSNCEIWFVDYKLTSFCANQSNANYSCQLEEFMKVSEVEVIGNIFDNTDFCSYGVRRDDN